MSAYGKVKKIVRAVLWLSMGLLLLVAGLAVGLYSPWVQQRVATAAVTALNRNGNTRFELGSLRLRFPLRLEVSGLYMIDNASGDTLVAAREAEASARILPLLGGDIELDGVVLRDARYRMGGPESSMSLDASLRMVDIQPSSIRLGQTVDIDLSDALIEGGHVAIAIRPDTIEADTAAKEATRMAIHAQNLTLRDFRYSMSLPPTIDSLGAYMSEATLAGGVIDLENQRVDIEAFRAGGLDAAYITALSGVAAADTPEVSVVADSVQSAPWTINISQIGIAGSRVLYTSRGAVPQPGLDFGYIAVDSLDLDVEGFYNRASELRLPVKRLHGVERCGLAIDASGLMRIDSAALHFDGFELRAPATSLSFSAMMGMGDMAADPTLPLGLNVNGHVGAGDAAMMFPQAAPMLSGLPAASPVKVGIDVDGTTGRLNLRRAAIEVNRCVEIKADGVVEYPMDPRRLSGNLALSGHIWDVTPLKNKMLDRAVAKMFNIPPMDIKGRVAMKGKDVDGNVTVLTGKGRLALDAAWKGGVSGYTVALKTDGFPVNTFMPTLGIGRVTATVDAKGKGLDPLAKGTVADIHAKVVSAEYNGYEYKDITADVAVHDGMGRLSLDSSAPDAVFGLVASGNLQGDTYDWDMSLDAGHVDMQALNMSATPMVLTADLDGNASISRTGKSLDAGLTLHGFTMKDSVSRISVSDVTAHLVSSDSVTRLDLKNRDLTSVFTSPCPLDTLAARFSAAVDTVKAQIAMSHIDVSPIQRALPQFGLTLQAGPDNMITDILAPSDMRFRDLRLDAVNDSLIYAKARVIRFVTGSTALDTVEFSLRQLGGDLYFNGRMDNRPGTFDNFAHVGVNGLLASDKFTFMLSQRNISGKEGFRIGAEMTYADSTIRVMLKPTDPVIGYKQWTLNDDNFVTYNFPHRHLDANLHMRNQSSTLELYTVHDEHHGEEGHVHDEGAQEDVVLKISDIQLADWLSLNPFAPPVKGSLSADMRVRWSDRSLNGTGTVSLDSLYYGKERVGDFLADVNITTTTKGMIRAKADLSVDGVRTITVAGNLNDSTAVSPFNLDFSMIHFPLATVNPFMPQGMARLRGTLNGKMDITGDSAHPRFDGYLDFDSAAVAVKMLGASYEISDAPIEVADNVVKLENFAVAGVNSNPLVINGTVDINNLGNAGIDLVMKARNMGLVNTSRATKGADVFGKAYVDLDAKVKGNMSYLDIEASAVLLSETDVTYVIPDATSSLQSRTTADMVKFVQFDDTTAVSSADSIAGGSMVMDVDALLSIEPGSTVNVYLSSDGKSRIQIQGQGDLNYTMSPLSDGRLTGRLDINKGYVRYSLPVISEKHFDFKEGSYVSFNGDMMNPILNIQAVDVIKANVTQEGQNSRLVNFDVGLSVTGTLNTMNVAFDLSTDDDLTIANELQSMSAEQRANQAMNMLLYNVYTGPGTKASGNLSGNPLYSFLESQLNSWAAKSIKGVDLSFGIDQYDRTMDGATSTTTQYSYKVSKSLFNNRFKIIVGGNYSTDADTDENFSQNLINDIAFEYLLNRQGTMYIRLFRHTGYESILEGEVTQTGVGFVYKRKIRRLIDMFRPFRKESVEVPAVPALPVPASTMDGSVKPQAIKPSEQDETK